MRHTMRGVLEAMRFEALHMYSMYPVMPEYNVHTCEHPMSAD